MASQELIDRLDGRRVVASISGGKDSAAMSLWLTEQGIDHDRVFIDTGWEHAITYQYLRGPLAAKLGPIIEIKALAAVDVPIDSLRPRVRAALASGSALVARILHKGMFPSKRRRFCTQETKAFVIRDYIAKRQDAGEEIVNTVGIRAAESTARSHLLEWEHSSDLDCDVWRPLIAWSEREVIEIHQRHGLAPNPLYLQGASRVGCWPCIYARKSEIRHIADSDPERIELLRELEADVSDLAAARYAVKGETFESLGYVRPSFFQAPLGPSGEPWPIDRVVEWSRTIRGGREEDRQELLFAAHNDGCMRWGLCDTGSEQKS